MMSRCRRRYTRMPCIPNGEPFPLNDEAFPPHLGQQLAFARADAFAKLGMVLPAIDGFLVSLDAVGNFADGHPLASNSAACSDSGGPGE